MKRIILLLDDIFLVLAMISFVTASYLIDAVKGTYALAFALLIAAVLAALKLENINAAEVLKKWKRGK